MNKSVMTNTLSLVVLLIGWATKQPIILSIGLFAFSGAVTNWLAIHMLFEKVPGLYGSGVIPARFEDFKLGIEQLMMEQFFSDENIDRFVKQSADATAHMNLAPMIEKVDLEPSFVALVEVIKASSFGNMLGFVGGEAALVPLKTPFIEKMKATMVDMVQSDDFLASLQMDDSGHANHTIKDSIGAIVKQRLDELTPEIVKQIIQDMIKKHLGWLVVWGGVFGGLIGLAAAFIG